MSNNHLENCFTLNNVAHITTKSGDFSSFGLNNGCMVCNKKYNECNASREEFSKIKDFYAEKNIVNMSNIGNKLHYYALFEIYKLSRKYGMMFECQFFPNFRTIVFLNNNKYKFIRISILGDAIYNINIYSTFVNETDIIYKADNLSSISFVNKLNYLCYELNQD